MECIFSIAHISKLFLYKTMLIPTPQGIHWEWISELPNTVTDQFLPDTALHLLLPATFWDTGKKKDSLLIELLNIGWNDPFWRDSPQFFLFGFLHLFIYYIFIKYYDMPGTVWWMEATRNSVLELLGEIIVSLYDFSPGSFYCTCNIARKTRIMQRKQEWTW